jgi:hypothetical protein
MTAVTSTSRDSVTAATGAAGPTLHPLNHPPIEDMEDVPAHRHHGFAHHHIDDDRLVDAPHLNLQLHEDDLGLLEGDLGLLEGDLGHLEGDLL